MFDNVSSLSVHTQLLGSLVSILIYHIPEQPCLMLVFYKIVHIQKRMLLLELGQLQDDGSQDCVFFLLLYKAVRTIPSNNKDVRL